MLKEYAYNKCISRYRNIYIYIYLERVFMMASTLWRTWVTLTLGQRKGFACPGPEVGEGTGQ